MRKFENECSGEIPAVKTVGFSGVKLNNYLESRLKTKASHRVSAKLSRHVSTWKNARVLGLKTRS
jgi:hypothetical protein